MKYVWIGIWDATEAADQMLFSMHPMARFILARQVPGLEFEYCSERF